MPGFVPGTILIPTDDADAPIHPCNLISSVNGAGLANGFFLGVGANGESAAFLPDGTFCLANKAGTEPHVYLTTINIYDPATLLPRVSLPSLYPTLNWWAESPIASDFQSTFYVSRVGDPFVGSGVFNSQITAVNVSGAVGGTWTLDDFDLGLVLRGLSILPDRSAFIFSYLDPSFVGGQAIVRWDLTTNVKTTIVTAEPDVAWLEDLIVIPGTTNFLVACYSLTTQIPEVRQYTLSGTLVRRYPYPTPAFSPTLSRMSVDITLPSTYLWTRSFQFKTGVSGVSPYQQTELASGTVVTTLPIVTSETDVTLPAVSCPVLVRSACVPVRAADLLSLGPGTPPIVPPPTQQTLVLDLKALRWFPDQYTPSVQMRLAEPGLGVHHHVLGQTTGTVSVLGGSSDQGAPIPYGFRVPDFTAGDTRIEKTFGDLILDCDPSGGVGFSIQAAGNNFSDPVGAIPAVAGSPGGRQIVVVDLNGGLGYIGRSLGIAIVGADVVAPIWYLWEPAFVPKAPDTLRRATDWEDGGYFGAKFVQGLIIEADTVCESRLLQVEYDRGQFTEIFPIQTDGLQSQVAYSFQEPFVAHLLRLVLVDMNFWRFYRVRWVYEPMPEAVSVWETQPTTLDLPGYSQEERVLVAHMSTSDFDLSITADGRTLTYRVPNSGGQFVKTEILEAPNKGKVYQYRFATVDGTSSLRLFLKDCECRHRAWGGDGYQVSRPFGDISRESGARI